MSQNTLRKKTLIHALFNIRSSIEEELQKNTREEIIENYEGGISLCSGLLQKIESEKINFPCDPLLETFNRYVADSLPYTGDIEETIHKEFENLRKFGVLIK